MSNSATRKPGSNAASPSVSGRRWSMGSVSGAPNTVNAAHSAGSGRVVASSSIAARKAASGRCLVMCWAKPVMSSRVAESSTLHKLITTRGTPANWKARATPMTPACSTPPSPVWHALRTTVVATSLVVMISPAVQRLVSPGGPASARKDRRIGSSPEATAWVARKSRSARSIPADRACFVTWDPKSGATPNCRPMTSASVRAPGSGGRTQSGSLANSGSPATIGSRNSPVHGGAKVPSAKRLGAIRIVARSIKRCVVPGSVKSASGTVPMAWVGTTTRCSASRTTWATSLGNRSLLAAGIACAPERAAGVLSRGSAERVRGLRTAIRPGTPKETVTARRRALASASVTGTRPCARIPERSKAQTSKAWGVWL
jgi:hypothetical protein